MANIIAEMDVPLTLTMTDTSKELVRRLVGEIIEEVGAVFPTEERLRAFIHTEVRKALAAELKMATRGMM